MLLIKEQKWALLTACALPFRPAFALFFERQVTGGLS